MRKYRQGETVTLTAYITDKDNAAATPSVSIEARIADPDGTLVVLTGSATIDDCESDGGTGLYKYDYNIGASAKRGRWTFEIKATDSADNHVALGHGEFEVAEAFPA